MRLNIMYITNERRIFILDASDLSNIVDQHGRAIYSFCYYLANNKADTEDLYQETFLKALELSHKIDINKNLLILYGIGRFYIN